MGCYSNAKLAINAVRNLTSKAVSRANPVRQSTSRICPNGPSISHANTAKFSGFSSYSLLSQRLGFSTGAHRWSNQSNPFLNGAKRFYFVDRYNVHHFRPRGSIQWPKNPTTVLIVVLVCSGVVITVYFANLETVPYTKRKHFVILSKPVEKRIGEALFDQLKTSCKGKILPASHPESIRVRLIAKDIIEALQRGLRQEQVRTDLGYASPESSGVHKKGVQDTLIPLFKGKEGTEEEKWFREEEILDDEWVQRSRKKGQERGLQATTSHLDGLNWEVLVVNEPVIDAFSLPSGKLVVFTGLLEHFKSDAEIATIIAHEVGHVVARHSAEKITKELWFAIVQLILHQFALQPDANNVMSTLLLRLPFSRKMEIEADYIGLLLMASAGYDPRVAPKVYEKLGKVAGDSVLKDYFSSHPSANKRSQLLAQAKVMEEALTIYKEVRAGRGIEGFL